MRISAKLSRVNVLAIVLSMLLPTMAISPADAGGLDFDDQQNAKMARLKAKSRAEKNKRQKEFLDGGSVDDPDQQFAECGAVSIGNFVDGRGSRTPREINVLIDGDVINANNNCR